MTRSEFVHLALIGYPRSRGVYTTIYEMAGGPYGSSPLARGLRRPRRRTGGRRGIIPARAGFTPTGGVRGRGRWDHPRSRGVYPDGHSEPHYGSGSSPLARGLRLVEEVLRGDLRIIPARAGFTQYAPPSGRTPRDHPRSRGVYRIGERWRIAIRGSSPLARGLRGGIVDGHHVGGIIPARAGFTSGRTCLRGGRGDHPRSRGVYGRVMEGGSWGAGSSPLARGLHPRLRNQRVPRGIIPARAGFTPSPPPQGPRARDHPRSRGVYVQYPNHVSSATWIIPAREGFTFYGGCIEDGSEDHPRSRGVYRPIGRDVLLITGSSPLARGLRMSNPRCVCWGSSPLARGLHHGGQHLAGQGRIIPARAGFTFDLIFLDRCVGDHPRSRGVYESSEISSQKRWGSSPLARGLPSPSRHHTVPAGIIPARAGFTPTRRGRRRRCPDHPRSRGVYSASPATTPATSGSSPLARGLRSGLAPVLALPRIIPARAGFTLPRRLPGRRGPDHPRSRGVYGRLAYGDLSLGGSSPLARGLQGLTVARVDDAGIIPARAGFT